VCVNEALYDPAGPDAGREFVELFNPDSAWVALDGWRVDAGNGATPGDWRTQWVGGSRDRIAPRGFFLIAGAAFAGAADARAPLELQNGPDAVRLVAPSGWTDRVGWGELEAAEFFEGAPAPDVPSGWSLARVPDGRDGDQNASDLQPCALPTPGTTNAPGTDAALGDARVDPPLLDPGGTGELRVTVRNAGAKAIDPRALTWELACPLLVITPRTPPSAALRPGETATVVWDLAARAGEGSGAIEVSLSAPGGSRAQCLAAVRVGRGRVWISEVQYDPAAGEGEWVELTSAAGEPIDLAGWQIADASGRVTPIATKPFPIAPGGFVLVAESAAALRLRYPELPVDAIAPRGGSWPSLNNSVDRELGYADQVLLLDAEGGPVDYVRYAPGDLDGDGVSLERWIERGRLVDPRALVPCPARIGCTPGAAGWVPSGAGNPVDLEPRPFFPDRADGPRLCRITLPGPRGEPQQVTVDVFSLAGERVATLVAGASANGPVVLAWDGCRADGRPLPTGIYLVRAALHAGASGETRRVVRSIALVRE
jgi:hypothetical protein